MMNDKSTQRPGRPKHPLTPEAALAKKEHRRRQLAEAQARRRQKLVSALEQVQQVSSESQELEGLRARVSELESALADKPIDPDLAEDLAYLEKKAEDLQRRNANLNSELSNFRRENERLVKELRDASKAIKGKITLAAPDARERAKILLEQLATTESLRGEKREARSDEIANGTARLTQVVRQAKVARTALEKVSRELKDIVTEGERDILMYGRQALTQICEAAELAKEQGQRLAAKRKAHEEAIEKAASQAVASAMPALLNTVMDQVLFVAWKSPWDFRDLTNGAAFARETKDWNGRMVPQDILESTLRSAVREARESLVGAVRGALKEPRDAHDVLSSKLADFFEKRDALRAEYGALAEKIQVELVARRLEQTDKGEVKD
jgi:NADH dehydrogenase/NADH:ubiquinone oxidoreductase subunit G